MMIGILCKTLQYGKVDLPKHFKVTNPLEDERARNRGRLWLDGVDHRYILCSREDHLKGTELSGLFKIHGVSTEIFNYAISRLRKPFKDTRGPEAHRWGLITTEDEIVGLAAKQGRG